MRWDRLHRAVASLKIRCAAAVTVALPRSSAATAFCEEAHLSPVRAAGRVAIEFDDDRIWLGGETKRTAFMRHNRAPVLAAAFAAFACFEPACAEETLPCARFSREESPAPMPSPYPSKLERLNSINQAVKSSRYSILFFGDSLTEGWDAAIWERSLAPRGALNAGVSGDRTDHLLWRLQYGNLAGPEPRAVVLLIGTNDLAYGRSPVVSADGIRSNLEVLRHHLPEARILLLGLLPREETPNALLRVEVTQVNELIRNCADNRHIFYAEIGDVLLDRDGFLPAAISPDQLHLTELGYTLLAARLDAELDRLLGPSQ